MLKISIKDLVIFGLIALLFCFGVAIWMKMDNVRLSSQVMTNAQNIQQIATFIQKQQQPQAVIQPKVAPAEKPVEKDKE